MTHEENGTKYIGTSALQGEVAGTTQASQALQSSSSMWFSPSTHTAIQILASCLLRGTPHWRGYSSTGLPTYLAVHKELLLSMKWACFFRDDIGASGASAVQNDGTLHTESSKHSSVHMEALPITALQLYVLARAVKIAHSTTKHCCVHRPHAGCQQQHSNFRQITPGVSGDKTLIQQEYRCNF